MKRDFWNWFSLVCLVIFIILGVCSIGSFILVLPLSSTMRSAEKSPVRSDSTPPTLAPAPIPMIGPMTEDDSKQHTEVEAAFKAMDSKFQALQGVMRSVMSGEKEPTPEMQNLGMLMMQVMQYGQSVRILGMSNSQRAKKRLGSGLAILEDLVNEAYEEAKKIGLIEP